MNQTEKIMIFFLLLAAVSLFISSAYVLDCSLKFQNYPPYKSAQDYEETISKLPPNYHFENRKLLTASILCLIGSVAQPLIVIYFLKLNENQARLGFEILITVTFFWPIIFLGLLLTFCSRLRRIAPEILQTHFEKGWNHRLCMFGFLTLLDLQIILIIFGYCLGKLQNSPPESKPQARSVKKPVAKTQNQKKVATISMHGPFR